MSADTTRLDEQDIAAFRDNVRAFIAQQGDAATARPVGYDGSAWQASRAQLGLDALIVPLSADGQGFGLPEAAVALEEAGASLALSALLPHVVSVEAIKALEAAGASEVLAALAKGALGTLALIEPDCGLDAAGIATRCQRVGDVWRVDGTKSFVALGAEADLLIVLARGVEGLRLLAVDGDGEGVVRTRMRVIDETRPQAVVSFKNAIARDIGAVSEAQFTAIIDIAAIAYAAENVGLMRRCLAMSVAYAKERVQFGRPIGSFQAIKHKCAEMFRQVELGAAAVRRAVTAGSERRSELASIAKAYCSTAAFAVATETIHVHGGIGFTWEHPAHLFYKRAKTNELMFGDSAFHYARLAGPLGLI